MERFAPNTAALDTPSVEGEAMGLFRSVCITRPATDSPAPATIAARTRGMRMFQMMRTCAALPRFNSAATQSAAVMRDEPTNRQTKASTTTAKASRQIAAVLFFLFFNRSVLSLMLWIVFLFPVIHKPPGGIRPAANRPEKLPREGNFSKKCKKPSPRGACGVLSGLIDLGSDQMRSLSTTPLPSRALRFGQPQGAYPCRAHIAARGNI